jgi:hypothetical protein
MSRRLLAALVAVVWILSSCGRTASVPQASGGYRLFLAESVHGRTPHFTVRDSQTGKLERELVNGTPSPDWSRYYTVVQSGSSTRIRAINPATGATIAEASIPQGYTLPELEEGPSGGLSPDGQWIVLTTGGYGVQGGTNFLVGSSSLSQPFTPIHLDGQFEFDAISNDGTSLYLIDWKDDKGHYQVRLYDLASKALAPQPIVDKREPNEPMNGVRGDSIADSRGSYVFTVYARDEGPFVHALPLTQPFAWCVDLPASSGSTMEDQFHWSLALAKDGMTIYAVNAMTGQIAQLSTSGTPNPPVVSRIGKLPTGSQTSLLSLFATDAEAKGAPLGGAALSPDGRTLFAVGNPGVLAIDTATLKVRSRYLPDDNIPSLRFSADGKWLYAADPGVNKVWQLDPVSGAVKGQLNNVESPWAVLWASPR